MGSDEVGDDVPVVYEPGRRRATYTPPVRRKPVGKPRRSEPATSPSRARRRAGPRRDELASALEHQVSQLTVSTPVVQAPQGVDPSPTRSSRRPGWRRGLGARGAGDRRAGTGGRRDSAARRFRAVGGRDPDGRPGREADRRRHRLARRHAERDRAARRSAGGARATMAIPIQYPDASTATPEPVEEAAPEPRRSRSRKDEPEPVEEPQAEPEPDRRPSRSRPQRGRRADRADSRSRIDQFRRRPQSARTGTAGDRARADVQQLDRSGGDRDRRDAGHPRADAALQRRPEPTASRS